MVPSSKELYEKSNEHQHGGGKDHNPIPANTSGERSEGVEEKRLNTETITPPVESTQENADVVATEDYSVFTVRQKRLMIATASFASWIR